MHGGPESTAAAEDAETIAAKKK
eukprot:SAG11_NODE_10728_length_809_cov_1.367606_1_plen_22_part_10